MIQSIKSFLSFVKSVYSEPDGTGSSTRIHISLLIAFVLSVGISFGYLVHRHTITVESFNGFLASAGTFLVSTCGPLYGLNKAADWAKSKQQNGQQQ